MHYANVSEPIPPHKYLGVDHKVWLVVADLANELGGIDKLLEAILELRKVREDAKQADLRNIMKEL